MPCLYILLVFWRVPFSDLANHLLEVSHEYIIDVASLSLVLLNHETSEKREVAPLFVSEEHKSWKR